MDAKNLIYMRVIKHTFTLDRLPVRMLEIEGSKTLLILGG